MRKSNILDRYTYAERDRYNFCYQRPALLAQASPLLKQKLIRIFDNFHQMLEGFTDFEKLA